MSLPRSVVCPFYSRVMRGLPSHTAHFHFRPHLFLRYPTPYRAFLSVRGDCPHGATLRPLPVRNACTYKRWSFVAPSGVTRDYCEGIRPLGYLQKVNQSPTQTKPYNTLPPFEQRDSWSSYGAVRAYSEVLLQSLGTQGERFIRFLT